MKIKVNIVNIFNQIIEYINQTNENYEKCDCSIDKNQCPKEIQTIDIKLQIVKNIIDEVAKEAATLENKNLIDLCSQLGYIFTEEQDYKNGN